jgi:probable blue pigment (indigoidine) exporter
MVMATSPIALMLLAWPLLAERPRALPVAGAVLGIAGVLVMLASGTGAVDPLGVLASGAAMAMSSVGYILAKRWGTGIDVLSLTSWQLIAGGLLLAPAAVVADGTPPALDGTAILGFAYVSVVATAVAFWAWFGGLRHLGAGTVGLVGLLNPVTGVLLGTLVAAEPLGSRQLLGLALVLGGITIGQPVLAARSGRIARHDVAPRRGASPAPLPRP